MPPAVQGLPASPLAPAAPLQISAPVWPSTPTSAPPLPPHSGSPRSIGVTTGVFPSLPLVPLVPFVPSLPFVPFVPAVPGAPGSPLAPGAPFGPRGPGGPFLAFAFEAVAFSEPPLLAASAPPVTANTNATIDRISAEVLN